MKKLLKIIFASFILCSSLPAEAQLGNRLKQAATRGLGNALEKRVEKEMENVAQRQLEKAFENIYGPDMPKGGGFNMEKILSGLSADVETAEAYQFSGYSVMEITAVDEKGKLQDPFRMKTYIDQSSQTVAMEFESQEKKKSSKTIIIYDIDRNANIFLLEADGQKSSMAYSYDFENITEEADLSEWEKELDSKDLNFEKTGRSKVIHGYNCAEYIIDSEEGKATYWITDRPIIGSGSFWGESNPLMGNKTYRDKNSKLGNLPNGHMMEMIFESKKDQSKSEIKIIEINETSSQKFEMSSYPNLFKTTQM
ncbi:DUF4412 domain-containing protein [Belliella kenyensis]|uniref:DUF4412 domain-containing protein n=1 Tax=Belliella kenyensis TaxID=1472724 RepID=A0ABV8EQY6_9BACT|nr:DUF4412 domain-containing protein [Belliella kenyensis]MCH7402154.1 DUF4412 domain-containing protein [Belliella kenyensis]MDN3601669.1 DUF4412 domain-containing protein [Belliella kenyensis]